MVSVSGAWEARFVAAHVWMLSFTDMGGDKTRAAQAPPTLAMWNRCKDIQLLLFLFQKEQHKQYFQPHIFISVFKTFK